MLRLVSKSTSCFSITFHIRNVLLTSSIVSACGRAKRVTGHTDLSCSSSNSPASVDHTCSRSMSYSTVERGSLYSDDYRLYLRNKEGRYVSPFHDIPLYANKENSIFNMVVEVPRWTNAKMEIKTSERLNPIQQDVKKGKVRFVNNVFPHHGYIWNYGALPQTWEDPGHTDSSTDAKGDNDPIDVCEIGQKVHPMGAVIQVKILGAFALIDEGETDWKLLAIDITDPLAGQMNVLDDVEREMKGYLRATHEWFKIYKIPAGKPPNTFAFNGEPKNRSFALTVIEETHNFWKDLIAGKHNNDIATDNTGVEESAKQISQEEAEQIVQSTPEPSAPQPIPDEVHKTFYLKSAI